MKTKKFFEIISEEPEDSDKWTWQPIVFFAVLFVAIAILFFANVT